MDVQNYNTDLLSRGEFVDTMCQVARSLAKHRKNACYALNGGWGTGKTFVLDMFCQQLQDAPVTQKLENGGERESKFLVFRYNCWEYDYYDEPLVAIVSAMMDEVKKFECGIELPQVQKNSVFETVKSSVVGMADAVAELSDKGSAKAAALVIKALAEGKELKDLEDLTPHDPYVSFKKILKKLQSNVQDIAGHRSVILVVDELDRCLPEYSIKVLERLHHLFDGIDNVQVILAVDKSQLEHVVREIYGEHTNVDRYLAKFIRFELKLSEGSFTEEENRVKERFREYMEQFTTLGDTSQADTAQFVRTIFEGIDMRSRIAVLDKCLLLHEMMLEQDDYKNAGKMDPIYLCVELLLTLCQQQGIVIIRLPGGKDNGAQYFGTKEDLLTLLHKLPPSDFVISGELLRKMPLVLPHDVVSLLVDKNTKQLWPDFTRNLPAGFTILEYASPSYETVLSGFPPIPGVICSLLKGICEKLGDSAYKTKVPIPYAEAYLTLLETLS